MQALRIDLDDDTLARLTPIARARGLTLQELATRLLAAWTPRGFTLAVLSDRDPILCRQCGAEKAPRQGGRGLCGKCYMVRWRAGTLGSLRLGKPGPKGKCRICGVRKASEGPRCGACYRYLNRTGRERLVGRQTA